LVGQSIPIPKTTAVHGITDDKVANEPTFKDWLRKCTMIKDSDLAGFNLIV
jgi:DNA polymerase-3 subunit epsilon